MYLGETLFEDARQLRRKFGDAAFFENLNQQGGDDGWGKSSYEKRWDVTSLEDAMQAAPGSDPRSQLISALQRTYFSSYATQAESNTEAFLPLDKGLQVVARHAKSLGYDAVLLFLDELVLWLAGRAADPEFVHQEVQKLVNLVESQDSRREIPIISFVARQRDLVDLLLLRDLLASDIATTDADLRAACQAVFDTRAADAEQLGLVPRHWPPVVQSHPHWLDDYARAAGDAGLNATLDDAIAELNDWIDKLDAARSDDF